MASDLERTRVLYVDDDRGQETLDAFWLSWTPEQRAKIEAVGMDMWEPYVRSTLAHLPDAARKIVFDKFRVAQHLNTVDEVRRREHRVRLAAGSISIGPRCARPMNLPTRFPEDPKK